MSDYNQTLNDTSNSTKIFLNELIPAWVANQLYGSNDNIVFIEKDWDPSYCIVCIVIFVCAWMLNFQYTVSMYYSTGWFNTPYQHIFAKIYYNILIIGLYWAFACLIIKVFFLPI